MREFPGRIRTGRAGGLAPKKVRLQAGHVEHSGPEMGKSAVFLDRDGTIIEERHYLSRPEEVRLLPGAAEALQRLARAGYLLFLVTNQSGVGRGYFTLADVERVHERLTALLAPHGVRFAEVYVAPEAPDQPSQGRKPSPHFLFQARDRHGVDLARSYMIGDKRADLECGWNAGVQASILVLTGYGADTLRTLPEPAPGPLWVVQDLPAAADAILRGTWACPGRGEGFGPAAGADRGGAAADAPS